MRRSSLFTLLGALAAAAAGAAELPDNPLQGRLLFESKHCHQCHGIAGSRPGIAPDLGGGRFGASFLDLGAALWNHVPGMSVGFAASQLSWPELSEPETVELLAFLYFIDYLGDPGVAARGERIFLTQGCAACHTIGSRGSVGPDLAGLRRFASPLYVAQAIWNHGPSMLATMRAKGVQPPRFAAGDLADLSAFVRQQGVQGPQERVLLAPGNPNRGRQLFRAKGCAACHGSDGRGGADGPDLGASNLRRSAATIAGNMWNHALAMETIMRERGIGWPVFTTAELADVVAFLYFLPFADPPGDPRRGAELFMARGCAGCHAASVDAERRGPALSGAGAAASPSALVAAMWNHAPIMREAVVVEGRPWPELSGDDLRDLLAFLAPPAPRREGR